jgi:ABC-type antimicrobial peptide transport system permease subunit
MIPVGELGSLVGQNLRRNRKHIVLSAIGIVVGIAAFSFFLALGLGVRRVVLGEIFPIDRVEVIPSRSNLGAGKGGLLGGSEPVLDDDFVAKLRAQKGVAEVFPKMKLAFPARGWGGKHLFGLSHDLYFEVSGFADGVDPALVDPADVKPGFQFKDYEADPNAPHQTCYQDSDCQSPLFCAWDVHQCQQPVPVLVSKYLVELYNGSIAPAHNFPKVGEGVANLFVGLQFTVELGRSFVGDQAKQGPVGLQRRMQLVGISDRAIPLGITIPIGYVKRWNQMFAGPKATQHYSSVVAIVNDESHLTGLTNWIKAQGFDISDSAAQQVGVFITIVTLLLTFISVIIVGIAAVNIAHTFFMVISERRREIGVLRAVGASESDIRRIILSEAAIIGFSGGVFGLGVGYGASRIIDFLNRKVVPDFPFKPTSYFHFTPGLCVGAIGFAVIFCLLGAYLPARRAAAMEPAAALAAI